MLLLLIPIITIDREKVLYNQRFLFYVLFLPCSYMRSVRTKVVMKIQGHRNDGSPIFWKLFGS